MYFPASRCQQWFSLYFITIEKIIMRIITYSKTNLVSRHRGTLPILLTCPHDGTEQPPNVEERTGSNTPSGCPGGFKTGRDLHAAAIAKAVAQKMYEVFGESPYVVIAEFSRKFIDANRRSNKNDSNCAFADKDARVFYDEYHNRINSYVNQILNNNNNFGFLFDIHGMDLDESDPADIYLGTRNGDTLQPGFARGNLFKRRGLVGLLQAAAYSVPPPATPNTFHFIVSPPNKNTNENPQAFGGFTVKKYGGLINAVQIELAPEMRNNDLKKGLLIEELAYTLPNFVMQYVN
jgi:N-formylglutamate amidohydrolase